MAEYSIGTPPVMSFTMGSHAPQQQPGSWPRVSIGGGAPAPTAQQPHAQAGQVQRQPPRVAFAAPSLSLEQLNFCRSLIASMMALRPTEDPDVELDEDAQAQQSAALALAKSTTEALDAWIVAATVVPEPEPQTQVHAQEAPRAPRPAPHPSRRPGLGMPVNKMGRQYPTIPRDQKPGIVVQMQGDTPIVTQDTTAQGPAQFGQPSQITQHEQQMMPPGANSGSRYTIGAGQPLKFTMQGSGQFAQSIPDPSNPPTR